MNSLRLELIRLVYRHDHTPSAMIERANQLEAYVAEQLVAPGQQPRKGGWPKGRPRKPTSESPAATQEQN